ncbi:MAG: RNA polymerase factor sigma-54 [Candidatus Poribacteria bacterium]
MDLRPIIEMRQRPQLVMTPRLQQAIKVLAMPRLELQQHLKQELEQNPFLDEDLDEDLELDEELKQEELKQEELDPELNKPEENLDQEDNETDISWEDCFDDTLSTSEKEAWEHHDNDELYREDFARQESLQDFLSEQLDLYPLSDLKYRIGEAIIGNIDDDGYLKATVQEIADDLGCDATEVEEMLKFIQYSFEPTGVGARDFRECLLIQIKVLHLEETLAGKIIDKYFKDFEENNIPNIARSLEVDIEDVLQAIEEIKQLELYPGRQFGISAPVRLKIPDVIIQKVDDKYQIISNDDGMPKLRINKRYLDIINSDNDMLPETRSWLENSKRRAIDLVRSYEQRRQTILNVAESIFKVQKDFLEQGVKGLKPLLLRDVAELAHVHESTVSRVSRGKYVQTPQGVYELKDFFSVGLENDSGQETSTIVVKDMIKEMVASEDAARPLSDQHIVNALKEKGITVARRTVAKYRNELNIPPSSKRRKRW